MQYVCLEPFFNIINRLFHSKTVSGQADCIYRTGTGVYHTEIEMEIHVLFIFPLLRPAETQRSLQRFFFLLDFLNLTKGFKVPFLTLRMSSRRL